MLNLTDGQIVFHARFGQGHVEFQKGETAIIRFGHGLEECKIDSLQLRQQLQESIESVKWDSPLETITRVLSETIVSVNDNWGVFSLSRIKLLPHQLWVCHKVLRQWPFHFLVADDVGLGKTIEAGLILWPLLTKNVVKRLLVICPSSLVEQWQFRLRDMFDIRLTKYTPDADTPRADFWNTQHQVVSSLQTLRKENEDRHQRILDAEPWDLLIIDEAHHLNADEKSGATLGYKFVDKLIKENKVTSSIFFSGTPHRGKDYGFFSMLRLLRPDLFGLNQPISDQLANLQEVLIRNNKQNVTDMQGKKIFKPVAVFSETYAYTAEENRFYDQLTEFIATGKAYASSLSSKEGRAVMLVLIAMQKLASSSVAAIRKALKGRLERMESARTKLKNYRDKLKDIEELLKLSDADFDSSFTDEIQKKEEEIDRLSSSLQLMEDEIPQLEILIKSAEAIDRETKIEKIIDILQNRFTDRSVLFFTEYKATQALLMSALIKRFGDGCVAFINGDNRIDNVIDSNGRLCSFKENRYIAAERFNNNEIRYLVSTEAAGEGVDLQVCCSSLIHVDLPWNPMRLHQRVGRLNRYGQKKEVEVITLRNPDTVESRIWDKLNDKIGRIMLALQEAMDDPEDLLQLVLGMASPSLFTNLFSQGADIPKESFSKWFDKETQTFGGLSVLETVKQLVGHSTSFDYQNLKDIPPKDLEDLQLFFEMMLTLNKRRISRDEEGISFKTPDEWLQDRGVRNRYDGLVFKRDVKGKNAALRIAGVGHRAFDQAIQQARNCDSVLTAVSSLENPMVVFQVHDRVTERPGNIRKAIFSVKFNNLLAEQSEILLDWQTLDILNNLLKSKQLYCQEFPKIDVKHLQNLVEKSNSLIESQLEKYDLPFLVPEIRPVAMLLPCNYK